MNVGPDRSEIQEHGLSYQRTETDEGHIYWGFIYESLVHGMSVRSDRSGIQAHGLTLSKNGNRWQNARDRHRYRRLIYVSLVHGMRVWRDGSGILKEHRLRSSRNENRCQTQTEGWCIRAFGPWLASVMKFGTRLRDSRTWVDVMKERKPLTEWRDRHINKGLMYE